MDGAKLLDLSVSENGLQQLFATSDLSAIGEILEQLTKIARTADGRSKLASKSILTIVLQLCRTLSYPSKRHLLLWCLRLIRNLCAVEIRNQDSFIGQNGVAIVSSIFSAVRFASDSDYEIIRIGLQVLANVSLAGEAHLLAVWHQLFPIEFLDIAKMHKTETCDPLCMIIYTCSNGSQELFLDLCTDQGLHIIAETIKTASRVGFQEDWLKLLLSRICLEESHFTLLFSKLCPVGSSGSGDDIIPKFHPFVPEQTFLLCILSEILSERIGDITISIYFAECVLRIFASALGVVDFAKRGKSCLPTGSPYIDILGYSLIILRDICATDGLGVSKEEGSVDIVELLLSSGLLELVLSLLMELEPPSIIRKALKKVENQAEKTHNSPAGKSEETTHFPKLCPYQGFRRDLVAVTGNCAFRRKHVQDRIREKKAILCIVQQCVTDEDNPFLREWGIWSVRNILEGNQDNQRVVSELEIQGSVDVPEIADLGLRVEVDEKTRRATLVNT